MSPTMRLPDYGLSPVMPHAHFVEGRAAWMLGERCRDLNARVGIFEDFLRDYLWLVLRSKCEGREILSSTPLAEFRVVALSRDEGARLIGEVMDRDIAEHKAYWSSKVWC